MNNFADYCEFTGNSTSCSSSISERCCVWYFFRGVKALEQFEADLCAHLHDQEEFMIPIYRERARR
jgi:hypothetical protein